MWAGARYAEAIGPLSIIGDRISNDVALRLSQPLGCALDFSDGRLVQRKGGARHNKVIIP